MRILTRHIKSVLVSLLIITTISFLYYIGTLNFILAHTIIEFFGIIVAFTIFIIGWNTIQYSKNNFMIFLSIGYFFVSIIALFHTLSYKGMNVIPNLTTDIPTQLWVIKRFIECFTILLAFIYLKGDRKLKVNFIFFVYSIVFTILMFSVMFGYFPKCYIDGDGLTRFKVTSEYIIASVFLIALIILAMMNQYLEDKVFYSLMHSIILMIFAEVIFTIYNDVYGVYLVLGHIIMLISRIFIYYALIYSTLRKPYNLLFKDIAEYTEKLERLNKSLRLMDIAMESCINAIALINIEGNIIYANEAFSYLCGFNHRKELIDKSIFRYLHNGDEIKNNLSMIKNNGYRGEVIIQNKNGLFIDCVMTISYLVPGNDEAMFMISIMDISELKSVEKQLIEAKKEADSANMAKSTFLANMSHEIRTPINGIKGFLYLLEKTKLSNSQLQYLNNIKISTDTLLNVINDILDVSKIEAGRIEFESNAFDLYQILDEVMVPFIETARNKKLSLNLKLNQTVPQYICGDSVRLKQVLINLLSNSVKFTNHGFINLEVKLLNNYDKKYELLFIVEDSGIGMSKVTINSIFQPYIQANVSIMRKFGGTGLGLAICKSIVEMMNGAISVESEEGKGSKFSFNAFFDKAHSEIIPNNPEECVTDIKIDIDNLKILLVEDNEINIVFLTTFFNSLKLNCDIAKNGKEAVDICLNKDYDLVFMDCLMPIMDGYEATKLIRLNEREKHTIIIALTACAMKEDIDRCLGAGMDDYVSKPIDIKQIKEIINKYAFKV